MPARADTHVGARTLTWPDETACAQAAAKLATARVALADAFITLEGPLGAGKTTFVRHLLRALGVSGRIKSPTFAVLEPHTTPDGLIVSHFDFYRFDPVSDPRAWHDAGFRDVFAAPGLKLAEWPAHAGADLPEPDLRINLAITDDDQRQATLTPHSTRGQALLEALA